MHFLEVQIYCKDNVLAEAFKYQRKIIFRCNHARTILAMSKTQFPIHSVYDNLNKKIDSNVELSFLIHIV